MKVLTVLGLAWFLVCLATDPVLPGEPELTGAGATFPYPFYSKAFDAYDKEFGVKVNYQAIGSGGGIKQLENRTVDFGGTDAFMTDEELKAANAPVVHIPTCVGAVAVVYSLPGAPRLRISPGVLADIFLGRITAWNDERLKADNPGVTLPDMAVVAVHRSDGSGTTFIFSDYLSKVSEAWKSSVGAAKSLSWPGGLGAKGNPGVAGLVGQIPGSVGYVELVYALQNGMPVASIENKSGDFIQPSIKSVSLAAGVELPADTRVSITDTGAAEGYPISGFTWIILYREQDYDGRSGGGAEELVRLLWWMIHEGQEFAEPLDYAPLPAEAVRKAEAALMTVTYDGRSIAGELGLKLEKHE
jgi:phosphate transport system substrate-binding protein